MKEIKVVEVLLRLIDGENAGSFALQQRSEANKTYHYVCQGTWAGKFEDGEGPEDAAKRECQEEMGQSFCQEFNFNTLKFIGTETNLLEEKNYLVHYYLGTVAQDLLEKAELHKEALPNFVYINEETKIEPMSSGKDARNFIVVPDDNFRVFKKIFNGNTGNKK